jgi:Concanavalin A-like lectin/glucanases superfamily
MRKEAACIALLGVLWLGAGSAHAASAVLADWRFDEGAGQAAADASGRGSDGQLGASVAGDAADPAWIAGHDGGSALAFGGADYVAVPDAAALEPGHVAVEAWVRRAGSPGVWRYVLSKGSLDCDRSAYGLYSGWAGGMSFYVSNSTSYFISPEVPAATVWDGSWHHVIGSYDGDRVRLWIDGAHVGSGTAANIAIAYGTASNGIYVGIYRGSCDLGFDGAIDDVKVWDDAPPQTTVPGPVVPAVPGTPTAVAVGGGRSAPDESATSSTRGSGTTTPRGCLRVSLSRHTIPVKRRAIVLATVRRAAKRLAGASVVVLGADVNAFARTNSTGTARIVVRARKRGRLTVRVRGQKASCPSSSVRAR